ncbi:hypothetical protein QEV83_09340 [Methylocapsa sp. D3K7]|uniref:hypothetical protein n=1 Tax=Methylocapsa sp. D3K7 TaxID=3041435 RepID=UPI00244E6B97|nr:hypothetical protein [Methylocapsa sp. D3K7]WGJ16413.1 hypothetical protein QEV83_09340 [Methylocapsa sp. D3K7]
MEKKDRLKLKGRELVEADFIHVKSDKVSKSFKSLFKLVWGKQVIQEFSAGRYFPKPFKVPNSDHFSITKPESEKAIQHEILREFIFKNFIAGAKVSESPRVRTH